jgi:hypothetical protein
MAKSDRSAAAPNEERQKADDLAILSGFLSEPTRKVRRVLLALGALGIALRVFRVHVQEVTLLGTKITIAEERWFPFGLLTLIGYFVVMFGVYAMSDLHRHGGAIARIARRLTVSLSSSSSLAVNVSYRASRTAALLLLARVILDVLLPVVLAGVAMFVFQPWR